MILIGMLSKEGNLAMMTMAFKMYDYSRLEEAENVHEAARIVWQHYHPRHFLHAVEYVKAEMHDTETCKTWSVDEYGHTLKDYRKEKSCDFRVRYNDK